MLNRVLTFHYFNAPRQRHYVTSINMDARPVHNTFSSTTPYIFVSSTTLEKRVVSVAVALDGKYQCWDKTDIILSGRLNLGHAVAGVDIHGTSLVVSRGTNALDIYDLTNGKKIFTVIVSGVPKLQIGQLSVQVRFRRLFVKFMTLDTNGLYETSALVQTSFGDYRNYEIIRSTESYLISIIPGNPYTNKLQRTQQGIPFVLCPDEQSVGIISRPGLSWVKRPNLHAADICDKTLFWSTTHRLYAESLKSL